MLSVCLSTDGRTAEPFLSFIGTRPTSASDRLAMPRRLPALAKVADGHLAAHADTHTRTVRDADEGHTTTTMAMYNRPSVRLHGGLASLESANRRPAARSAER